VPWVEPEAGAVAQAGPDAGPSARHDRRASAVVACVAAAALVAGGLVVVTHVRSEHHSQGESAALKAAIKGVTVKPLDLSKIAFAPKSPSTPTVTFGGAAGATAVGAGKSTGAGASSPASGNTATGAGAGGATTTPLPPSDTASEVAPPQFAGQLVSLYQQIYSVNAAASTNESIPSGGAQPESVSSFAQAVQNTPSADLNVLYTAVQKTPSWSRLLALYQQPTSPTETSSAPASSAAASAAAAQSQSQSQSQSHALSAHSDGGASPYPYPNSSTTTTFGPAVTITTDPSINEANCPSPAPGGDYGEDVIYAAQVAIDVFTQTDAAVPQQLTIGAEVLGEGSTITIPDPAWIIVAALLGAAQILHDTYAYDQAKANDCNAGDQQGVVTDIYDNVAYLTTLVDSRTTALENEAELIYALVDTQTTQILNQLAAVQASINLQIKVVIEQDLLEPAGSGSVVEVQIPASQGGYLNAVPIGVQAIVTGALAQMTEADQAVNPAAPQDLDAANADLAAGQYRAAYTLYAQAYKEIVQ
jgi:hypothetical protein